LLRDARRVSGDQPDSVLLDAALRAFLLRHRAPGIEAQRSAYDEQPLDTPDEWGDLASFRDAVADNDISPTGSSTVRPQRGRLLWRIHADRAQAVEPPYAPRAALGGHRCDASNCHRVIATPTRTLPRP
jgi:hypothetical protein